MAEEEKTHNAAQLLQSTFENANLHLLQNISDFNDYKFDSDEEDIVDQRDPAIVASDVGAQISFLRKLKFQYLEQNAKDRYVKSIVSDIDDAPIASAEDNRELQLVNEQKKEKLKVAKASLVEKHLNIRTLAPLVEQDYNKAKHLTSRATTLSQQIIDARLALTRLRQSHPHPRLTVPLADQKLADQVEEMQTFTDQIQSVSSKVQVARDQVKAAALEVESLRAERADVEKAVKAGKVGEDDGRLVPLYDWYTASLALHCSTNDLLTSYTASDNELRLTYQIDPLGPSAPPQHPLKPPPPSKPHEITILLIFAPNSRRLAAAQVVGCEELGMELGDVVDAHLQMGDVRGLVAAILGRVRGRGS